MITIRTFGTWLHGDGRHSVDRHNKNIYGTSFIEPNERLSHIMSKNMSADAYTLTGPQRRHVELGIREVCETRQYGLAALHVRTNHVHVVVSARSRPETLATTFKAYSTRRLRRLGLIEAREKIWSRGESTRYLWKEPFVDRAIDYVLNGQGDSLPDG